MQQLGSNSLFWTLPSITNACEIILTYFSTLFFFFFFLFNNFFLYFILWPCPIIFPHTYFLQYIDQKEFILSHASLSFKNKGLTKKISLKRLKRGNPTIHVKRDRLFGFGLTNNFILLYVMQTISCFE